MYWYLLDVAVELTPFGKFVKWVAFPAILATIGYRFLAPRIGPADGGVIRKFESRFRPSSPSPTTARSSVAPSPDASRAAEFERIRNGGSPPARAPRPAAPEASVTPVGPSSTPRRQRERPPIDRTND